METINTNKKNMAQSSDLATRPTPKLSAFGLLADAWLSVFGSQSAALRPIYTLFDNDDAEGVMNLFRQRPRLLRHPDIVRGSLLAQRLMMRQMACFEALAPLATGCEYSALILDAAVRALPASYLATMTGLGLKFSSDDYAIRLRAAAILGDLDWVRATIACCSRLTDASPALFEACCIEADDPCRQEILAILLQRHPEPRLRLEALALAVTKESLGPINAILSETSPQDLAQAGAAGACYPHLKVFSSTSVESRPQPLEVAASLGRVDILAMLLPILGPGIDGFYLPARKAAGRAERDNRFVAADFIRGWMRSEAEMQDLNDALRSPANDANPPSAPAKPRRL